MLKLKIYELLNFTFEYDHDCDDQKIQSPPEKSNASSIGVPE